MTRSPPSPAASAEAQRAAAQVRAYFAALPPLTERIRRAHGVALRGYETSKGTVRLPMARLPPAALVTSLVNARIAELRAARRR